MDVVLVAEVHYFQKTGHSVGLHDIDLTNAVMMHPKEAARPPWFWDMRCAHT